MQLLATTNHQTGKTRFYVDGTRVPRRVMDGIKRDHELDTFYNRQGKRHSRAYCYARREKP